MMTAMSMAGRCRECLAAGIDALPLPGASVCALHSADGMDIDAADTGLSQDMGRLDVSSGSTGVALQEQPTDVTIATPLKDDLVRDFVEAEVLHHFQLVAAARGDPQQPAVEVKYPVDWASLASILSKLGYDLDTDDYWQRLGLARLEGEEPTELIIENRHKAAVQLCSLTSPHWTQQDLALVRQFALKLGESLQQCVASLKDALALRRRIKAPKLPLHKELGEAAFQLVAQQVPSQAKMMTQWSDVLLTRLQDRSTIEFNRRCATLAEKGDGSLWDQLVGLDVVMWAPMTIMHSPAS